MKSEEFINEAGVVSKIGQGLKKAGQGVKSALTPTANLGFGYEKPDYPGSVGTAKGVLGRLASDLVGAENYAATAQALGATGRPKDAEIKDLAKDTVADIRANPRKAAAAMLGNQTTQAPAQSKFQQQFELVDDDPVTIQYKNNTFQRDQYGKWIDFRTGKEAPDRFSTVLDKIAPPVTDTSPTAMQLPVGAVGGKPAAKPAAPAKQNWQMPTTGPAVWKSNRPEQPASAPATPAPQAKARLTRNTDGSITVVDKMGKKWTKPANMDSWTTQDGQLFRQGSSEYEKLNSFVQNLKESLGRKRR